MSNSYRIPLDILSEIAEEFRAAIEDPSWLEKFETAYSWLCQTPHVELDDGWLRVPSSSAPGQHNHATPEVLVRHNGQFLRHRSWPRAAARLVQLCQEQEGAASTILAIDEHDEEGEPMPAVVMPAITYEQVLADVMELFPD